MLQLLHRKNAVVPLMLLWPFCLHYLDAFVGVPFNVFPTQRTQKDTHTFSMFMAQPADLHG